MNCFSHKDKRLEVKDADLQPKKLIARVISFRQADVWHLLGTKDEYPILASLTKMLTRDGNLEVKEAITSRKTSIKFEYDYTR